MRRPSTGPHGFRAALAALAIAALAAAAAPASALAFGPLSSFGSFGEAAGQMRSPTGLAIGADGTVYVAEFGSSRVSAFGSDGTFAFALGKGVNPQGGDTCTALTGCGQGIAGGAAGALAGSEGIAVGPEGNLFIAGSENHRIDVFNQAGAFLFAFGKKVNLDPGGDPDLCNAAGGCRAGENALLAGSLASPSGLAFDSAGRLFVADSALNRVSVFSPAGVFLFAFGKNVNPDQNSANRDLCTTATGCQAGAAAGAAGALTTPFDVEVAPNGTVLVSDLGNRRVDVFSPAAAFLFAFGKGVNPAPGAANRDLCNASTLCVQGQESALAGGFTSPAGVAVAPAGDVYVADPQLNRIDQFSGDGVFVRAFGTGVVDGADAFQICTLLCQAGSETAASGSIPFPQRVALDCRGALYTTSQGANAAETERFASVKSFGEPVTASCGQVIVDPPAPSNRLRFGKLILNKRRGTAVLTVSVPGPGRLVLKGKGIRTVKRAVRAAGRVKLPINPTGKAKRTLARTGTLRLKAKVTFAPTGGTAATQVKTLRLKRLRR